VQLYLYLCTYWVLLNISINWCYVEHKCSQYWLLAVKSYFHLILTRDSQDLDHYNILIQFWGHMCLENSTNTCTFEIFFYKTSALTLNFFSPKHFWRSPFIFTLIRSHGYQKIATMINCIERHTKTDTYSVLHSSCND